MNAKRTWCQVGKVVGLLLALGPPIFALFAISNGLRSALSTLGSSGIGDPAGLAGGISEIFHFTIGGLVAPIFGVLLFIVSVRSDRRLQLAELPPLPPQAV